MTKNLIILTLTALLLFVYLENSDLKDSNNKIEQKYSSAQKELKELKKQLEKYNKSLLIEKTPISIKNLELINVPNDYKLYLPKESYIDLSKVLYDSNQSENKNSDNSKFNISPKLIINETKEDIGLENIQDLGIKNLGIDFKFEKKF